MHYTFYVTVHARPAGAAAGPRITVSGRSLATLKVQPEDLAKTTFADSFETTVERLAELERMFCEPDGSFVWVGSQQDTPWQVDGNLYDRDGRLLFVDLKGNCPRETFDRFLTALGWPTIQLMFQLTREAVFLDEAEFRSFAAVAV